MEEDSNLRIKILGIIMLIGGIGMVLWGYQMSESFLSQLVKGVDGSFPQGIMIRYIVGSISSLTGLFLLSK